MVIIEWLKSCLRHLVLCFWVRFISLLASEVEPSPKVKWGEPRGEETTPKKTTEDKNDSDGNKSKEKDEYKNEHECRNEDDQEVILYPEEPKERIQVAYVEPKLLTEDEAHSVPAEEPALSTDESEDNAWEGEEPCVRASITVGNVHTSAKQSESSSYLSCHLQEAKVANAEAKLPQLKQRVGNANLEKSEDEDDDDDSPWIGLGHSTRLTRYSGVQDLLAHSEETPSVIDKRVPGNALRREGPLLLPRSSFIRSRSLEKSQLEEIPEEDRRLSIDESTSENQSDKIWAQLVAKYAEEQPHQETAVEFQGDSTCEKVGDEKGLKENEDCKGISTHSFLSMKTASDASTDFTDENMMSEKFSAQVGQRLNMYLARLEESKEDSEVEGKDAAEEAREVEYDSLDIEMEEGSEDKILIMIEDDESNGDRSEVQNDQNKKTFEDNLGEIVEKSTHLPHLVDSGESNNGILNFSKLPDEELGVELSIENRESLRPQGISECHPSESCSGGEKRKEYQEGPLLRDSEALTSIELEKIQESQRVDENEKLSKGMELENVTSDPAIKDIDFETNTDSQSISLKNEEPESFKDKQQIIPITTSKVNEGERSDQLIRSHSSPDETICESVLPKLSEISRNIIESPTQGRNEEPQGNLLSQKQEETTVIKDSLGKEAVIATPTDEDFAQMLECVDNRTQATEVDKTNQTLQGVTETELEVKANISKANEIKVEEVLPIESTDPKEDVPIFNIKLRRKSSPVVASDEHVVEELPEVSFSVPIRRKSKGEESLRKKALENLRRKNSSETGQISFEMRQDLISEKSEKEMAEVDDTQDETTKTIEEKEDTDKGEQSKNREELKETEDQLLHRGNEKGTLIVCDEIKNNKDANEASPQVMDLLKRRTSRDLWKMECDKLLEVRNKDDAEDADVIQEADVFNTRYEEFPEDYVSIETFNPIDLTYFIDQSKEGNERDEQLDELSLKEEGHSLQQNTRDDNENLKGDKENYLTATNKSRIDVKEALDSKTIPQTGTKVNAMEIKLTDEETQIIDSEKHKEEVDFVSEVYSEQLIQNPDEVANVRNALTFSEEDLVAKILSQKSNEDYQDNTTTDEFCKISQNEILKIDEKPEKSDIFKENIVKDDVVLEKNKTVDMSLSKESEEALQSHITDSGHSEKEHLLNLIRKERDGEKRSLSEEEIPDYLDEFKDLLVPRARRKKAKKRITAITDIVDLDEPKLSSELLKFSDAEASSVRNDLYDPVINETGKEIATHEFLPDEEGSNEFQERKEEQRTYKEAQRKELEKYLSMPDALTEEEQQELEELLAREESEKAIVAASEARLDSILSEVRKRLDTSEIDDGNLEHFLNLPVALSKEEENLLTTAEKEENEPKDFETEDEYREFIRQRYLDELEEDRLRVEDEELDFGGSYYEEDDDYEYDYKEYDGDLEGLIFTKDMEAEGKGEEGASGFEDKAVGSDDLLENLGENRKEIKTKEPKAFFSLANLKLTRKSTPRGSMESIGRTASQDSSKEESTGEEFSHTSKKFFRYGSPGVKRKKKCQTNGNGSFGESPEPMDDVEFEEEKSTIGEFAKNISDDDDVSQTNIHSLSIDGVCLKQDMSMSMKTLAEECENTQDKLTAIEVRCNASKEKEDGLTSGIVESGVNLAKVSTKEVLQDLSNGQIRTFFSTNPEVAPTTKIPLSQDSKGAVDNGSNDGLEEDIKVNHSRGDEIKRDTIAHGTYVVIMETEDCILSRVEERDKNSTKTAMPSSDSNLGGSEGTFSEQSVEVLEGETASPHVDEEKKNVRLEVSDLDETIMSGRRDFGRSSVTSTPAVNGVSSLDDDSLECCPTDVLSDVIVTSVASNCSPSPKQYRYDPSAQALHSELEDTTEVGESSHMFPCTSQVPLNQPSLQELIEAELTARLAPLQPDSLDTIAYPKYHEHTRITSDSGDVTLSCTSVLDPPEALEGSHFSPDSLLDVKTDIHLNASSSPPPLSHSQSSSLSHVSQTTPPNGLINHLDIYNESVPHTTRVPSVSHSMHLPSVSLATHTPSDLINEKCKGAFKQIDLEPLMDSTMVLCSTLKDSEVTSLNLPDVIEHSISSEVIENNTSCLPAFPSNLTQSERPSMNSEVSIDDKITTPSINILDYDNDDKITTPSINILDHDNIDSSYAKTDDLSESPMSSNNLKDLNQRPPMNSEVSIEDKITTPSINILDHENIDSSYAKTDDLSESPMSSNNLKDLNQRPPMNSEVSIEDKITTPSINILDHENIDSSYAKTNDLSESPMSSNNLKDLNQRPPMNSEVSIEDKITTPSINILDHENIDSSYAKTDDLSESPMSSNNLKDLNQRPPMNSEVSIEDKITTPSINILDHENIDSSYAKTDDLSESPMSSNNLKDLNQRLPMNSEVSIEDKITTPSINILDHENIDSSYAKTDDLSESPMSSNNLKDLNQRPPMNSGVSIEDKITTPSINILDHENIDSSYAKTDDLSESSMFSNNLEDLNADFKLSTTLVIEEPSKDVESSSVHPELMHLVNDENDVEQDEKVKAADYVESGIDIPSCHLDLVDVTLEDKDKEIINEEIKGCEIESHIEKTAVTEDLTPDSSNKIRDSTVSQLNTKSCSEKFPIKLESESKEILTNMTDFDPIADHTISPGSSQQEPDAEAELDLEKVIRAAELKWFALKQGENQNGQGNDFAKDNLDEKVTISASYDTFSVGTSEEKEVKGHMKGEHSIDLSENTIVNTTKDYDLPEEYQDTKLSNTSNGPCVTISSSNGISENIIHSNCENEIDDQSLQTSIDSEITQSSPAFPKSHPKEIDTTNSNNVLPVDVLAKISETETSQLEGVDVLITSSLLQSVGTTNGGYKSETANGDVWPEKDKKSKSAALDEFEKMEKEVMLEMEKNKEGDKKDKKKKKKKKKSDVEKENQKTTQRSKEGLLEKHVGPRIRSFDPAKMKTKFSKPKEPTQVSTDCRICGKQVFQMEKIVAEKASWHKNCFRCKECNKNLTLETYQSNEGTLYCKPHFKELFRPKAVVINEDEERKDRLMRRPRMIILESQPEALPDDVVRATDKPDYGLEELQQTLNVKQRFSMFENLAKETEKPSAEPISVRRSRSLMSKAARFLDGHDDKGDVDADYDEEEMSEEEYDEEEQCEDETEYESTNSIVRSKKKKERPMSFSGMGDLKAVWEQKQRREEMSQARKEEISKFRLMLCAGKNSTLKERFESGIFEEDEEEGEERRRNSKEEIKIEGKRVASNLMKKFERGEPFILEDEEDEEDEEEEENGITRKRERSGPEKKEVEEIFKEAETAKKARNVFKQIDQHVAQEGGPILRSHSFASTINQEHRRSLDSSALGHQTTRPPPEDVEVIKSGEKKEDFQVDTTDLASRFRFFLDYEKNKEKEKEEERKVFRITPPREGIDQVLQDVALTKANMPKPCMAVNCTVCKLIRGMQGTEDLEVLGRDPNLIKCTDNYQDDVDCGNTQNILQMFKKMEMGYDDEEEEEGPRPLKRFTPPPDGREYDDESEYSDEEYSEDEEDDEQDEDENQHPEVRDELLQMTAAPPQSARKAASLRAKFERWEAEVERNNDINKEKEELEECMPSLDTAKNLRAMFEHKASEVVKPIASKPITQKINRFVGSGDKCVACNKCVYAMEKLEVHGKILHKSCFRCHKCSTKLSMGSFSFGGGDVMYCTTHYKQLFTQKGSYDAFLEEKGKWTKKIEAINDPSTKSQD